MAELRSAGGCIVIVTWNGERHIAGALDSCREHAPGVPVVVVDNGSRDATMPTLRRHAAVTRIVAKARNTGYGAAANAGFRVALSMGAQWALLMNQDAMLTDGAVGTLVSTLADHPRAAAVQPLLVRPDGLVNSAGNPLHRLGFSWAGGNALTLDEARASRALSWLRGDTWPGYVEVPVTSGAAVMFRLSALADCGGFEPSLFLYHEDTELSLRLRAAGWSLLLAGSARVVHDYTFSHNARKWFYLERNRHWMLLAHYELRTLMLLAAPLLGAELAVWLRSVREGWAAEKLRSYIWWLQPGAVSHLRQRRSRFTAQRRCSDAQLLRPATWRLPGRAAML